MPAAAQHWWFHSTPNHWGLWRMGAEQVRKSYDPIIFSRMHERVNLESRISMDQEQLHALHSGGVLQMFRWRFLSAECTLYNHLTSALRQIPNTQKSWTLDSVFRVHLSPTESPSNCNYKYNYVPNSKFLRHSIAPEDDVVQCMPQKK